MKEPVNADKYRVKPGSKVLLKDYTTDQKHKDYTKEQGEKLLQNSLEQLSTLQDKLYASGKYSCLIVLQAMDAGGKDSTIKHITSGLNATGVKVNNFKVPSSEELNHDYFWRHYKALPERGQIGIFNRSHYENVLVTRVHPEFLLKEKLPGINSVEDVTKKFWKHRFEQINNFEQNIVENGTLMLKFFLHVSKSEQKKRFLERIDNPKKNWKFSVADLKEREHWDEYQKAYEDALSYTSTKHAPWYVIPADDKWYLQLAVGTIINSEFEKLNLSYPKISKAEKAELLKARDALVKEA
ncbi:MAG TPA: polyphosphate kinase 2 family protein [Chitinophagaceae bacterium]|nr:polyphosphate kinase 2 family protein [Chitinophagaceae bacterium]